MSWILVKEVAAREIRTRSRTKAFRVITGILVAASIIGPIVAAVWPESGDDLREVFTHIVVRGQQSGELNASLEPSLIVATILSISSAILSGAVFDPDETSPEEARRQFFEIIFAGIRA